MAKESYSRDKELLARIAERDARAFEEVYDQYKKRIYTVCLQYLHSEERAEDALQEIFLKLWRLEDNLTSIENLESYLLKLTKHKCLNMLRRMKLESVYIEPLNDGMEYQDSDTEDRILLRDTKKIIQQAVDLLPQQQKLVYQLCHLEGLKYREVAAKLNISPETVRVHLKLALRFLRIYVSKRTEIIALLIIFKIY